MSTGQRGDGGLMEQADILNDAGEFDEAQPLYERALEVDPANAEAAYAISAILNRRGDLAESFALADRFISANPTQATGYVIRGKTLLTLRRFNDAASALARAVELDHPPPFLVSLWLGFALEHLGRLEEAEEHLRTALEADVTYQSRFAAVAMISYSPGFAEGHHALARVLQRRGNIDEAKLHYHLTKRVDPLTELDPMYGLIMEERDLENHPYFDAAPDLQAPELTDDVAEHVVYLLRLDDASALVEAASRAASVPDILAIVVASTRASQQDADYEISAKLRVVGDALAGQFDPATFAVARSAIAGRLLQFARDLRAQKIDQDRAIELGIDELQHCPPEEVESFRASFLALVERFVELDAESALSVAIVATAALKAGAQPGFAGASLQLLGKAYRRVHQFARAAELFEQAAAAYEEAGDAKKQCDALGSLSRANAARGMPLTVAAASLLMEAADRAHDESTAAWSRARIAGLTLEAGDAQHAYEVSLDAYRLVCAGSGVDPDVTRLVAQVLVDAATALGRPVPDEVRALAADPDRETDVAAGVEPVAAALLAEAIRMIHEGRAGEAAAHVETVRSAAKPPFSRETMVKLLSRLGSECVEVRAFSEAKTFFKDALSWGSAISADVDLWPILWELSDALREDGRVPEAVDVLQRALMQAEVANRPDRVAAAHRKLALLLFETDPAKAEWHADRFAETVGIDQSANAPETVALDRAVQAFDAGDLAGAESSASDALAIAAREPRNERVAMSAEQMLGKICRNTSRYHDAIAHYERALDYARGFRDRRKEGEIRGWLAIACRYAGDFGRATAEYEQAIAVAEEFGEDLHAAGIRLNFAQLLSWLGRAREAQTEGLLALKRADNAGDDELALRAAMFLDATLGLHALPPALAPRVASLLPVALESPDRSVRSWARTRTAEEQIANGAVEDARRGMTELLAEYATVHDLFNEAVVLHRTAQMFAVSDPAYARESLDAAMQIARDAGHWKLAAEGASLGIDLAVAGSDADALERYLTALRANWTEANRSLREDRDRIAFNETVAAALDVGAAYYRLNGLPAEVFEILEWSRARALLDLIVGRRSGTHGDSRPLTLGETRAFLVALQRPAVVVILDFVMGELIGLVLRSGDVLPHIVELGFTRDAVERMRADVAPADAASQLIAALSAEFVMDDLVLFVVDETLQELPLHAARLADGTMLFERAACSYAPSISVLAALCEVKGARAKHDFVAIGVAFRDEALAILGRFGGMGVTGNNVAKPVVIERMRDTSVVHFSCHGIFGDRYLDSGMVLAETETPRNEQILSPADIMREHIENDLVTLSACETARGEIAGSEFLGLARAFLAAGTRSVIATLWPVDGLATRDFMLSFYSVLLAGNAPLLAIADALRAAQIDRLSAGAPAHDFAAFKLVGCPQVLRAERT